MAELKGSSPQPSVKPEKPELKSRGFKRFLLRIRKQFERPKAQPVIPSEPEPQQVTPIPEEEPEKKDKEATDLQPIPPEDPEITEFRRALGLPEQTPTGLSPEQKREKRKQALERVLPEQKAAHKANDDWDASFRAAYEKETSEKRNDYLSHLPLTVRLKRFSLITKLAFSSHKSLKETASLISDLEKNNSPFVWEDGLGSQGKGEHRLVLASYSYKNDWLTSKEFLRAIREVPNLPKVLKRLATVGCVISHPSELESALPLLAQVAQLGEEKYQQFISQYKRYSIIGWTYVASHPDDKLKGLTTDFSTLVKAMIAGGFSDEQLQMLDETQTLADIFRRVGSFQLSEIQEKKSQTRKRLVVLGEFFRVENPSFSDFSYLESFLNFLDKNNQLDNSASLIDQGIEFDYRDYALMKGIDYTPEHQKKFSQSIEAMNTLIFSGQLPFLQTFQEYLNVPAFTDSADLAFLLPMARTLVGIDRFPKDKINYEFNYHHPDSYKENPDKRIEFAYDSICYPTSDVLPLIPEEERPFWDFIWHHPSSFEMTRFLCFHRQDFPAFVENNLATPKLIMTALAEGIDPIAVITDELIDSLPESEQPYYRLLKISPAQIRTYLSGQFSKRSDLSLYYRDGHPTAVFFKDMVAKGVGGGYKMLTPEVIESFPEEERQIWRLISHLPENLHAASVSNINLIRPDGIPMFEFYVNMIYKVGEGNYRDLISTVTEEFMAALPKEEQAYWKFLKDCPDRRRYNLGAQILKTGKELIKNQSDIDYFLKIISAKPGEVKPDSDLDIGERVNKLQSWSEPTFDTLIKAIIENQLFQIDIDLNNGAVTGVDSANWPAILNGYLRVIDEDNPYSLGLSEKGSREIKALFEDPKTKAICLEGYRQLWLNYLKSNRPEAFSFSLTTMSEMVSLCEGAGPLSQFEAIALFTKSVRESFLRETTAERTKTEIFQGLAIMERRFSEERWSNEDRTDFYNISRDILNAAPSLYTDFLTTFKSLSPSELKKFAKELYPLYRTQITLLEKVDSAGNKRHDIRELVNLRNDIRLFGETVKSQGNYFDLEKDKILTEVKRLFKDRFGIIKTPEVFTQEHVRSITNLSLYLANLSGRTKEKETILSFYLALMINDRWQDYREGKEIDPSLYLDPEKSDFIKGFLEKRKTLNPLNAQILGITQDELGEFQELLQQETQNLIIGNVLTIDIKLANVITNLDQLVDEDLYSEVLDKQLLRLYKQYGNKKVNSVLARTFQQIASPAKKVELMNEDLVIQEEVKRIISENKLELTPQTIKDIQDRTKPISTVINLLEAVKATQAQEEIAALGTLLLPDKQIIDIFTRLGEEFKPSSGAMALSADLDYLDNLVVKRGDDLTAEEKTLLGQYLKKIREQMVKMEGIFKQVTDKFRSLEQGKITNLLLNKQIEEIRRIIQMEDTSQAITSRATFNLNEIIENIRACLSCKNQGGNNDTDLTFGDSNKFYLYSQSEVQKAGSISDQILFVEPVKYSDGSQGIAFILDKVYGMMTADVLTNHVETVMKKLSIILKKFPHIKLSVFISDAAMQGISVDLFKNQLLEKLPKGFKIEQETAGEIDVIESVAGDHYIEFGGGARTFGKRSVSGLVIRV